MENWNRSATEEQLGWAYIMGALMLGHYVNRIVEESKRQLRVETKRHVYWFYIHVLSFKFREHDTWRHFGTFNASQMRVIWSFEELE